MPADVQMTYGISSAHAQWFPMEKVEQTIVMSLDDITSDHSCYLGREVYKES